MEAAIGAASDTDTLEDSGGHSQQHHGAYRNNNNNIASNPGSKQVKQANLAGHTGLYTSPCFPHGAILLDNGASTSIIWEQDLLTDIGARELPLTSLTNGGPHSCGYGGIYHGLQQPLPVWYAPDSVGNILALCDVRRLSRIMLDTATEAVFLVHLPDTTVLRLLNTQTDSTYCYLALTGLLSFQVEDDGIDTLVEDEANIEEGNETCIAEEEGAVHVEEEGAVHVEEEGASANMDGGNNNTGNTEGATQGGAYNL